MPWLTQKVADVQNLKHHVAPSTTKENRIMQSHKRPFLALVAGLTTILFCIDVAEAVLIHDPFLSGATPANGEYAVGADLGGTSPTVSGFSGAWSNSDPGELITTASGLNYTSGSVSVGSGGAVIQGNTNFDTTSSTRATTLPNTQTGPGEIWFAALFKADTDNAGTDRNQIGLTFDSSPSGTLTFGILDLSFFGNGATLSGDNYAAGTTALFLGRMTVTNTGNGQNESFDL
ncbi:MAG: hypothetical protein MI757_06785 [Pirellulales bacterium]|nr:hypothetical protein [Pirellulales bacterium]